MTAESQTLAEAKAHKKGLADAIQAHKANCPACGSPARGRARPKACDEGRQLAADHRAAAQLVRTWFDPGPDQLPPELVAAMIKTASIPVRPHWAGFLFYNGAQLVCPECRNLSPPIMNIYHAAQWVQDHYGECPGP